MSRFHTLMAALLGAGLLAAAPAAMAVAQASAQLTGLYIQVFDLNPADGIPAAVTFASGVNDQVNVYSNVTPDNGVTSDSHSANGPLGAALTTSSALGLLSASASTQAGDAWTAGAGPAGQATAAAVGADSQAWANASALSSGFTLTPNTVLVLSAIASASASSTLPGETAGAYAALQLSSSDYSSQSSGSRADSWIRSDGTHYAHGGPALTASFVNLSAVDLEGWAYAFASVNVYGVAAVPEPATAALTLAGLLTVGALARRRLPG